METKTYEEQMGEWVTARCQKRAEEDPKYPMPQEIKNWLDTGGKSAVDKDTAPTAQVLAWLAATAIDPDWPEFK